MGYIYKITNLKTKDKYIGYTTKTIQERFQQHVQRAQRNSSSTAALDIALRIVKASEMNNTQYLNYIKSLGIVPGKNIGSYLEILHKKDMELGNGKRLQYKIN